MIIAGFDARAAKLLFAGLAESVLGTGVI